MDTTPTAKDLWDGIGGHFDSFTQIICEFIDNSIANLEGNKVSSRTININIAKIEENMTKVIIEDTGTGIKDFQPVLKLGDKSVRESPLNEHGFGLKHALASANHSNDDWKIYTRTEEDFKANTYRVVLAPYSFEIESKKVKIDEVAWPGKFNGSGTIVEFRCSEILFNTIQRGIRGLAGFDKCLDYLREELGYIYSGVIEKGKVVINVQSDDYNKTVAAVTPDWAGFYKPKSGNVELDLGAGKILVEYQFGEMKESNYVKHYKRNMSTSGVEIRINGRLLMFNLFKEIWEIENHPSYNHFLVKINLLSEDRGKLPRTRTSKNGIRSGDEKLEQLYDWIKMTHPNPHKETSGAVSEKELVKELADLKEKHIRAPTKHIEPEFEVFTKINSPVSVDLYVYDGKEVVLYEAKKDVADVQNIYQLLMYWDGFVSDGRKPNEGILIASTFSPGVDVVLKLINSMKDQNGNSYKFSKKTWKDEGIDYPKP